jgi:RNA-binding protein Musashi
MPSDFRVFIPRIPAVVSEASLQSHFEQFGRIVDFYLPLHPVTHAPKGMAFISYATVEEVESAVGSGEARINGEAFEVRKADPRPGSRGGGGGYGNSPAFGASHGYSGGAAHAGLSFMNAHHPMLGAHPSLGMDTMQALSRQLAPLPTSPTWDKPTASRGDQRWRVFVKNLPEDGSVKDSLLRSYFEQFGEVTDVYQPEVKGSYGVRTKGLAFICYSDEDGLRRCIDQTNHIVAGITLACTRADPKETRRPVAEEPIYGLGGHGHADFARAATASRDTRGPQSFRIFVGGIPPKLAEAALHAHFTAYGGEIKDVYLPRDNRTGERRGFAYITFAEEIAVHRAIANAPPEIDGIAIGEIKIAEARPVVGPGGAATLPIGGVSGIGRNDGYGGHSAGFIGAGGGGGGGMMLPYGQSLLAPPAFAGGYGGPAAMQGGYGAPMRGYAPASSNPATRYRPY